MLLYHGAYIMKTFMRKSGCVCILLQDIKK